ncbi:TolC family protein [Persicitalea jodogahamensis]|uniref:Transporter n=1 Tax=Persicitalea jodogahamensis TaxID=402147 RepID=A0A8J3GB62_9BACT|nr:TolC family protein [Persicitalea jodogahamensis]GHB79847.1 transporter [Persicitalea jodogahamensis]
MLRILLIFMFLGGFGLAYAQVTTQNPASTVTPDKMRLTLEECVQIALQNNPQIKQAGLQVSANENNLIQSKWQRWPSLGFNASQGFSFGRNIDPFTNQFVQQNISFNNYSLNSSVTLFNGFQLQNNIKQNDLTLQASEKDLAATRNDIMLNVALAYLNIISNRELIEVARQQGAATQLQLDRTQRLVDAGSLAESQLFDLRAQLANDELSLVNAENNLESSKLQLKQLMNVPGSEVIDVQTIDAPDPALRAYENTVNEVFDTALQNLPQMEAAKLRVQSAGAAIEIAKAQGLPSLTFSGGVSTAFSSAAPKTRFVGDGSQGTTQEVVSSTRFVVVGDQTLPVTEVVQVPGGSLQTFNYFDQLNFNRNSRLNLSLQIPIFTNYQTKYRVANARIQQQNLEQQANIVTQQIRQNVEQAYIDMNNSGKRYSATANQVRALEEAFRVAESRFGAGAINSAEYNIAKANLDRARANLIQTKYDYTFRTKILDFYMNKPITVE